MNILIRIALLVTLALAGSAALRAQPTTPPDHAIPAVADDNMTPYRNLATDTLKAFQAHDMVTAKKKAKELETAWDKDQKALQKKSADVWNQIDKAMDDFIKPLAGKSPDAAKVQAAYDTFIAQLQLAVKG